MVALKGRLEGRAYSSEDWLPVRPLGKRAFHPRLIRVASLVVIVLVSLGLWVAIWEVVASFARWHASRSSDLFLSGASTASLMVSRTINRHASAPRSFSEIHVTESPLR
jgi:hypothetical protein